VPLNPSLMLFQDRLRVAADPSAPSPAASPPSD
jgi:hypothetical protein